MKETLYAFRKLGYVKSLLYILIYPVRFFTKTLNRLNSLHYEIRWNKKVFGYLNKLNQTEQPIIQNYKRDESENYFKKFGLKINTDWIYFYQSLSGINKNYFIPDNLFFTEIEPSLNSRSLSPFYTDKNNYEILLKGFKQPQTLLRFIKGNYFDRDYNVISADNAATSLMEVQGKWIVKPSVGSGGGKGVHLGYTNEGCVIVNHKRLDFSEIENEYSRGFIIQKLIDQHEELSSFHSDSLNTFRLVTLRFHDKIIFLSCVVKFGINNNIIDNSRTGAVWCGVNQNGEMHPFGFTQNFIKIRTHPTSGKPFSNTRFSFFKNVIKFAKSMHHQLIHMDIVSWDIGVDVNENPVMIEFNPKSQGIIGCQAANGPLFGDLTGDILTEVVRRRKKRLQT